MATEVLKYIRKLAQWSLLKQVTIVFLLLTFAIVTSLCFLHGYLINRYEFLFYILSLVIILFFVGLMVLWITFFVIRPVYNLTDSINELTGCKVFEKKKFFLPSEFLFLHAAVSNLIEIAKEQKLRGELLEQTEASLTEVNAHLRREITEKEKAEEKLRMLNLELEKRVKKRTAELYKKEENYRVLFEETPISIWEEDFSEIKKYLNQLQRKGVSDFKIYFDQHPDEVEKCLQFLKINDVNKATLTLHEAPSKKELFKNFTTLFVSESKETFKEELIALSANKKSFSAQTFSNTLKGKRVFFDLKMTVVPGYEKNYSKVLVSLSDITQLKQVQEELSFLAKHDVLTRLPNRALLDILLKQSIARSKRTRLAMAVMYVDLDGFKDINDYFGHDEGDKLLIEVAKKLQDLVREDDLVARMGGDEFVIVLNQLKSIDDAILIAEKIKKQVVYKYKNKRKKLVITSSIGIVIYPDQTEDEDNLIKFADMAMYSVKERGKNGYQFYNAEVIK